MGWLFNPFQNNIQQMFTLQIPAIDPYQGLQFYKETFDVSSGSVQLWGHSGGEAGISTQMYFDFINMLGIAVLANSDSDTAKVVEALYDFALSES